MRKLFSTLSVGREEIRTLNWKKKLSSRLRIKLLIGKTRKRRNRFPRETVEFSVCKSRLGKHFQQHQ